MRSLVIFCYVFVATTLFLLPNLTRREFLFGVPVPSDFRRSPSGRRSLARFRTAVGITGVVFLGLLLWPASKLTIQLSSIAPLIVAAVAIGMYLWENRRLRPTAVERRRSGEVEISTEPDRMPRSAFLTLAALLFLLASGMYLHENWARIPESFPVHWGMTGQADRWSTRSVQGVYGPLVFGSALILWLAVFNLASWYGARRSRMRPRVFRFNAVLQCALAFLFGSIAIAPVSHWPPAIPIAAVIAVAIGGIIYLARAAAAPLDEAEVTTESAWSGGMLYFNRADPALFVERRDGLGYTPNFARPLVWVLFGVLAGIIIAAQSTL